MFSEIAPKDKMPGLAILALRGSSIAGKLWIKSLIFWHLRKRRCFGLLPSRHSEGEAIELAELASARCSLKFLEG